MDYSVFNPECWQDLYEPGARGLTLQASRQAFANRFAANDALRTCDMRQTLVTFLPYSVGGLGERQSRLRLLGAGNGRAGVRIYIY